MTMTSISGQSVSSFVGPFIWEKKNGSPKTPPIIGQNCITCFYLVQWLARGVGASRREWTNHDSP